MKDLRGRSSRRKEWKKSICKIKTPSAECEENCVVWVSELIFLINYEQFWNNLSDTFYDVHGCKWLLEKAFKSRSV